MSSVVKPTSYEPPLGEGLVNAVALDAMVASIVDQINRLISALGVIRQSRGRLVDGCVTRRQLSADFLSELRALVDMLVVMRVAIAGNYDTTGTPTAIPTTGPDVDNGVDFFTGAVTPDDFLRPMVVDGRVGALYEVALRLRSVARRSDVIPGPPGVSLPSGFNADRRLYLSPDPIGVFPPYSPAPSVELIGVEHPAGTVYTNVGETSVGYPVVYIGNGNTGGTAPAAQMKFPGVPLTLATSGSMVRDFYSFVGWNTAADGSGTDYAGGGTYSADAPLTLYAKWQALPNRAPAWEINGSCGYVGTYTVTPSQGQSFSSTCPGENPSMFPGGGGAGIKVRKTESAQVDLDFIVNVDFSAGISYGTGPITDAAGGIILGWRNLPAGSYVAQPGDPVWPCQLWWDRYVGPLVRIQYAAATQTWTVTQLWGD